MKSGREKVAEHVAGAFQESAATGDQQDHERKELQSGQQLAAGRKLAFPPAFVDFSLGRFFGALALIRHLGPAIYGFRIRSNTANVVAPVRSKTAGYTDRIPARKANAVSILMAKDSDRSCSCACSRPSTANAMSNSTSRASTGIAS